MTRPQLLPESCPVCGGGSRRLFEKSGYWIRACDGCHHRFAEMILAPEHVAATYGDAYFFGGGAGYSDYLAEGHLLRARGRWYGELLGRYVRPGLVVDVGAAAGFVLRGLMDTGWDGIGIEPNGSMANYGMDHLGVKMHVTPVERFTCGELYDAATMIQVLPHLYSLSDGIARVERLVRGGGFVLVETWNRESVTARVLGRHWHEYSPPSVLHWFSLDGLIRLFEPRGFSLVAHGRPHRRVMGEHAKSLLRYKAQESRIGKLAALLARPIPDNLSLPYPADDLMWALFRKESGASGRSLD